MIKSRTGWPVRLVLAVVLAGGVSAMAVSPARAEVIDRIMAVVSGRLIMLTDVTAARDLGLVPTADGVDATGAVVSALIDRELMLREVERFVPPEPSPDLVEARLQAVRARFASAAAYQAALVRSGIDEAHLRDTIRQNLRIESYLDLRFTVPPPTDDEVTRYYSEHREAFAVDGRPPDLEAIRPEVAQVMKDARRLTLVDDWVAGLRRRADVVRLDERASRN